MLHYRLVLLLLWLVASSAAWAQYSPQVVAQDPDGRLRYQRDGEGNRIPDFSHAGYRGGGVDLPQLPVVQTIGPIAGDNTAHLQAAIDQVSALPPDSNGWRGALLLDTGLYEIHGTLRLHSSGVVLRGQGDGADPGQNTVLLGIGNQPDQRDILVVGGGSDTRWGGRVAGTRVDVVSDRVLVGENRLQVADPAPFSPGDPIVVYHPCTQAWLDAIDGGGAVTEGPWGLGSQPLVFYRRVTAVEDSTLVLDVPVYNTLDRALATSYVYRYDQQGLVREVGVEQLRIDIQTAGPNDEAHAWNALGMVQVEDAWVSECTFLHFGLAGVYTRTASRVTIADCEALDPVAQVTGGRMYNFNLVQASSQVLVQDCYASNGRHHYVSNGTSSVSGCVFLRCTSDAAYTSSEGHRRWSMGLLYDQLQEINVRSTGLRLLGLYNRGDYGTAHGWSAAHSVAWNCDVGNGQLLVQKPPTAQNYAIGCRGQVNGNGPFPGPTGYLEGNGAAEVLPASLYEAQLQARLAGLDAIVTDIDTTTSLRDRGSLDGWQVYPNPAVDQLCLNTPQPGPFQATLRDITGRALQHFILSGAGAIGIADLPPGCYLIELQQAGQVHRLRWLKQ